ncbi:Glycerol-3-phosphate dehydrogenase [NAD(+)], cytoplasmic [Astathelohania contejeani]|uniref:Glycerol-3-phosphate dehydrogenase [NAD(+)] n=1 Tax=Astathelohania contejeani TaxID=164912 RepID=A0ABQ7I062_9MICR|nr:Glycerol-3-phosphate dehydrogenase [NAD(+)], cytoplasmic [Thelohania contejeani]
MKKKISIIGSGNWGTTIGKLIAENIANNPAYDEEILMWTYEELIGNEKITDIINNTHINVKYLPGIKLPLTLVAHPNLEFVASCADLLVFVLPHQFVKRICLELKQIKLKKNVIGINLSKGMIDVDNNVMLISEYIERELGFDVSVLMGANIAMDVAKGCVSEGTLGYSNERNGRIWYSIFNCYTYRVVMVCDKCGVELSGTLKNIVSLGYGIGCGLGYPTNTTVAIMREGLIEIIRFYKVFHPEASVETLFESSGVADLIVSCLSGRNFKCGKMIGEKRCSIEEVENGMGGQKLQGTLTAKEIYKLLSRKEMIREFPLFVAVYRICYENELPDSILGCISYTSIDDGVL